MRLGRAKLSRILKKRGVDSEMLSLVQTQPFEKTIYFNKGHPEDVEKS